MKARHTYLALAFGAALAAVALWATALVLFSSTSEERRLGLGQEKSFGFFDAHLHVALLDVQRSGAFYDVLLQVRNDAARIDVHPERLKIVVVTPDGREYRPLPLGGRGAAADPYAVRFEDPVPRGTSVRRRLVFELPAGTERAALWVTDDAAITRFVPAHENSLLHARVMFDLGGAASAAARP